MGKKSNNRINSTNVTTWIISSAIGLAVIGGSIVGFYVVRNRFGKHEEFDAGKDLFI